MTIITANFWKIFWTMVSTCTKFKFVATPVFWQSEIQTQFMLQPAIVSYLWQSEIQFSLEITFSEWCNLKSFAMAGFFEKLYSFWFLPVYLPHCCVHSRVRETDLSIHTYHYFPVNSCGSFTSRPQIVATPYREVHGLNSFSSNLRWLSSSSIHIDFIALRW